MPIVAKLDELGKPAWIALRSSASCSGGRWALPFWSTSWGAGG